MQSARSSICSAVLLLGFSGGAISLRWTAAAAIPQQAIWRLRHGCCATTRGRPRSGLPTATGPIGFVRRTFGSRCDLLNRARTLRCAGVSARQDPSRRENRQPATGVMTHGREPAIAKAATATPIVPCVYACATVISGPSASRSHAPLSSRIGASAKKAANRRHGCTQPEIRKPRSRT